MQGSFGGNDATKKKPFAMLIKIIGIIISILALYVSYLALKRPQVSYEIEAVKVVDSINARGVAIVDEYGNVFNKDLYVATFQFGTPATSGYLNKRSGTVL